MKTQIWSKKDFTLKDLIDVTINCENNTKLLNSNFTPEYTKQLLEEYNTCLLYTSPSPRDRSVSRMPSSA